MLATTTKLLLSDLASTVKNVPPNYIQPIPDRLNLTEVQISDGTIHLIDLEGLYGTLDWPGMPRCWLLSGEELWDPGGSDQ